MIYRMEADQPISFLDALADVGQVDSDVYALPTLRGGSGATISWQTIVAGSASAIEVVILGAMNDVANQYSVLDRSTNPAGEPRILINVNMKFIKVRQVSRTGGDNLTVVVGVR